MPCLSSSFCHPLTNLNLGTPVNPTGSPEEASGQDQPPESSHCPHHPTGLESSNVLQAELLPAETRGQLQT